MHESEKWKWSCSVLSNSLWPLKLLSHVQLFATPWTAAYQAPLSMDFPGKSTGVGCHCLLRLRDGTSLNYSSKGSMDESVGGIHFFPAWFLRPFTTLVCIGNFPKIFLYIWYVFCLIFFVCLIFCVRKEMAPHSSVLAWRIPGTGEPGGLPSMGLHRVGHDWSELAAAAAGILFIHYLPHAQTNLDEYMSYNIYVIYVSPGRAI